MKKQEQDISPHRKHFLSSQTPETGCDSAYKDQGFKSHDFSFSSEAILKAESRFLIENCPETLPDIEKDQISNSFAQPIQDKHIIHQNINQKHTAKFIIEYRNCQFQCKNKPQQFQVELNKEQKLNQDQEKCSSALFQDSTEKDSQKMRIEFPIEYQSAFEIKNLFLKVQLKNGFQRCILHMVWYSFDRIDSWQQYDTMIRYKVVKENQQNLKSESSTHSYRIKLEISLEVIDQTEEMCQDLLLKKPILNQIISLHEVKGIILELSKMNMGSRIIQKLLHRNPYEVGLVRKQLQKKWPEVISDKYANYVVQKAFSLLDLKQKQKLLQQICPNLINIATTKSGTYCLQELVKLSDPQNISSLMKSILPSLTQLSTDEYGCHFVKEILSHISLTESSQYVVFLTEESRFCQIFSTQYGIVTLKFIVSHFCNKKQVSCSEVRLNLLKLTQKFLKDMSNDKYGHYLLDFILEFYTQEELIRIKQGILSYAQTLVNHPFGSNTIKICLLKFSEVWCHKLIRQILDTKDMLLQMMQSDHGAYVLNRILERSPKSGIYLRKELLKAIQKNLQFCTVTEKKKKWGDYMNSSYILKNYT